MDVHCYVGRFAPTPSGPLHFGSLLAAVGSYLQARRAGGQWLVRIEDLDRVRCVPGADTVILKSLSALGFEWDGSVEYQSRRSEHYAAALDRLRRQGGVYACACSRAQVIASNLQLQGESETRYPNTCRTRGLSFDTPDTALRFVVPQGATHFEDLVQGSQTEDVLAAHGDFILRRRDGFFAYHLAVVVDDFLQGITEIVRGADLLSSTPPHILLQTALGYPIPRYCHLPLALDPTGAKLSKSRQSIAIESNHASEILWQALHILRQGPPPELRMASLKELWRWAISAWSLQPLQGMLHCPAPITSSAT